MAAAEPPVSAAPATLGAGEPDPFGYEGQAEGYAATRPSYPSALLRQIAERPGADKGRELAVDACCGTGKLTAALAPHFAKVVGLDRSAAQLKAADRSAPNVEYREADGASLEGIAEGSADLVTIGQALHWLDASAFCEATQRVLKPGGHLAVLGYGICSMAAGGAPQKAFLEYYEGTLGSRLAPGSEGSYWDCDRRLLDSGHGDFKFPFASVKRLWHYETKKLPMDHFMGYLKTFSAYRTYMAKTGKDPLSGLRERLDPRAEGTIEITFPFFLILARAPESAMPSLKAAFKGAKPVCEDCVVVNEKHYPKGLNANFLIGEDSAIVTEHIGKFMDPEKRDIARAVPEILRVLTGPAGLTATSTVADIGAGVGLFLEPLSKACKQVLATEISPAFVTHLKKEVADKGLQNVSVVQSEVSDVCLPAGAVDVVLICDVYHHFEYPRTVCQQLREALRPGGRLVLIDFIRDEAVHKSHPPGWITDHVRAGQEVFREEIESVGFKHVAEPQIPGLEENYCMVFESPAAA